MYCESSDPTANLCPHKLSKKSIKWVIATLLLSNFNAERRSRYFRKVKRLNAITGGDSLRDQGVDSLITAAATNTESTSNISLPPLATPRPIEIEGLTQTMSSEFGPTIAYTDSNRNEIDESREWSAAVGGATLGKSGRVIERLMGENDMLKRDLNIERLRAEELNQAAEMAEAKMKAMESEYDARLHEATVNNRLLKGRERQLADYKAQIESEKQRTAAAVEGEREWRNAVEECKRKVVEAQIYAALMEGRNKVMTSHWPDQRAEVERSVAKLGKKINSIVLERKKDDEKINLLESLCDQQAKRLRHLELEKEGINDAFEAYKKQQEYMLKNIKTKATAQEKENEEILQESKRVLGELR